MKIFVHRAVVTVVYQTSNKNERTIFLVRACTI